MARKRTVQNTLVAAMLLGIAGIASATWSNGGGDVVTFTSSNPLRLIWSAGVRPGESGTNQSTYNTDKTTASNTNATSFVPSGYPVGTHWKPDGDLEIAPESTSHPTIWQNVKTGSSAYCDPNSSQTCAQPGNSVGTASCVSEQVDVGIDVTIFGYASDWLGESSGVVSASWSKGWSECKTQSSVSICPVSKTSVSVPFITYATTEFRSKYGWAKLTPQAGKIRSASASVTSENRLIALCSAVGGTYIDDPNVVDYECRNIVKGRVSFREFDRWPVTLEPATPACRIIKAI